MRKAAIVTIGDELMIGQIVDSNSAWIASWLDQQGWKVHIKSGIGDDQDSIIETIRRCHEEVDLVITTGGLGPTRDDKTKDALCTYYNTSLIWHEETWQRVLAILERIKRPPSELHKVQCYMPANAIILPNDQGSAPGMLFHHEGKYLIAVPGVPHEMKHLLTEKTKDLLPQGVPSEHRFIRTCGEGETVIAEMIADIESELPSSITLAYLPSFSQVTLRLSQYGNTDILQIADFEKRITTRLGHLVYGHGMTTLQKVLGEMLRNRNETIAIAESCTGGFLSHLFTSVAGSSDYFIGAFVPYAYRMKTSALNIKEDELLQYGAVSQEVVTAMAENARQQLNVTWALSTSGIAGPGGGTPTKPVGTIWIACAGPSGTKARLLQLTRDRLSNIEYTAVSALVLLRNCMTLPGS